MKTKQEIEKIADAYIDNMDSRSFWDSFINGYETCQKEYEEKLRWIPIYEPPRTAELVIVDSDDGLHACVAVAFIENGIWKYANGQTLWFTPRRWRYLFLNSL